MILLMRKPTKIKIGNLSLRESRILRLRFLDDCFHIAEDAEKPDDLFLIRLLEEARRLDNLINKSNLTPGIMKIEVNNLPVNETIKQKAVFIDSMRKTRGNVKESLKIAKLDKITALNLAANDSAFRGAWETAANKEIFS